MVAVANAAAPKGLHTGTGEGVASHLQSTERLEASPHVCEVCAVGVVASIVDVRLLRCL